MSRPQTCSIETSTRSTEDWYQHSFTYSIGTVAAERGVPDGKRTRVDVDSAAILKIELGVPGIRANLEKNSTHIVCLVADERAGMNLNLRACRINSSSLITNGAAPHA